MVENLHIMNNYDIEKSFYILFDCGDKINPESIIDISENRSNVYFEVYEC